MTEELASWRLATQRVNASNAALIDPQTNQPTRVGVRVLPDGGKERYAKKSGASLGKLAPAKKNRVPKKQGAAT